MSILEICNANDPGAVITNVDILFMKNILITNNVL